ncbi:MAG TPA: periplasmic heavy metal sensor [Rhizomicrobium sp.]|nr:periplasmic heavy metal sensor [Rhizomicrobium sp.]
MSDTSRPAPSGRSNVALIISLCLNLLLVGIIAVAFVRVHFFLMPQVHERMMADQWRGHDHGHGRMLWQMQQALTPQGLQRAAPAKAEKIQAIMEAHRARLQDLGNASINARRDAFNVFAADSFDKKAFDDALSRVQAADSAFEKELLSVLSDSAVTLSPEERKAVAKARLDHGDGFFWHHRFHHDFGGGPAHMPPPGAAPGSPPPGPPPEDKD